MAEHLEIYDALKQPPREALRTIQGGRLAGKTDINPQWRYKAMTEQFGVCGIGWKYEIVRVFSEPASESQVFAFAEVHLFIKQGDKWSDPIPGYGGSMLVEKERAGLHSSDEGYKMAITDALSTAMKMLGVAADIYAGLWDGTKYRDAPQDEKKDKPKGHWCSIHQTPFFKKGKMKAYAHPIKDASGITSGWCNEEEPEEIPSEVPSESNIDMDWLKESLATIEWTNADASIWIYNRFEYAKGATLKAMIQNLTQEHQKEFVKEIQTRLEAKGIEGWK